MKGPSYFSESEGRAVVKHILAEVGKERVYGDLWYEHQSHPDDSAVGWIRDLAEAIVFHHPTIESPAEAMEECIARIRHEFGYSELVTDPLGDMISGTVIMAVAILQRSRDPQVEETQIHTPPSRRPRPLKFR